MAEQDGTLRLRVVQRGGRTVLAEHHARAPLYLSPPLAGQTDDRLALALLTTGGGLLGDEQLALRVDMGAGTQLTLRTIGALRLLPSRSACGQQLVIRLSPGSRLTYLPEPLIPCAGASYRQRTVVDLEGDATVAIGEVLSPGRLARGERFTYRQLDLGLSITRDGRPLLIERLLLQPASGMLRQLLGGATHLGSLVIAGPGADDALVERVRATLAGTGLLGGASRPAPGLIVVRALGGGAHELQRLLAALALHSAGGDTAGS